MSHADLWLNNIMFRYGDDGKTPKDAILVDFQLARWAPPAYEVLIFIYLNTNSEYRQKHLQYLLEAYYTYLEIELNRHKLDIRQFLIVKSFLKVVNFTPFQQ